jgi:hypothetical protein
MAYSSIPIRSAHASDSVEASVRDAAQRSAALTRTRLHLDSDQLSCDELRGYIRARAIGPIRLLIHELAVAHRMSVDQEKQLIARTLDRTVHTVLREMSRPIFVAPTAYLPLRVAA